MELVTAHVACHHGESDYVAARELNVPGCDVNFDVQPADIENIGIVSDVFSMFSSFGSLDSVRYENPGIQMLEPAAAFAPAGTTVPYTNTGADQLITNAGTSILSVSSAVNGVGDMPNNSNGVDEAGCGTFEEICDTVYMHTFWTPSQLGFSNCTMSGQDHVDDYRPAGGYVGEGLACDLSLIHI